MGLILNYTGKTIEIFKDSILDEKLGKYFNGIMIASYPSLGYLEVKKSYSHVRYLVNNINVVKLKTEYCDPIPTQYKEFTLNEKDCIIVPDEYARHYKPTFKEKHPKLLTTDFSLIVWRRVPNKHLQVAGYIGLVDVKLRF